MGSFPLFLSIWEAGMCSFPLLSPHLGGWNGLSSYLSPPSGRLEWALFSTFLFHLGGWNGFFFSLSPSSGRLGGVSFSSFSLIWEARMGLF